MDGLRFGFIKDPRDHAEDIYVSYRDVPLRTEKGITKLIAGEMVEFEIQRGAQGPVAKNITFPDGAHGVTLPT